MDDPYSSLLEKARVPQPSLQKLAVIAIFDKFLSQPSNAGREAINRCLRSTSSPAVVEQSTRGLCRLVKDAKFDISAAFLELQSALEDCSDPQLTGLYVKSIGFLCRIGFMEKSFESSQNHPFVRILSCGTKVEDELVKQIILFIAKCKHLGMEAICEYLRPFLNYSFVRSYSSSSSFTFSKNLISAMVAFCCSSTIEAVPLIKLLTRTLKYLPCKNAEEVTSVLYIVECLVDAYLVVLRQLVGMGLLVNEAHLCGITLVEAILSQHRDFRQCSAGVEKTIGVSRHLLSIQKELGLSYRTELSSVLVSLFSILLQSELELEHFAIMKLVLFLVTWKGENANHASELDEAILFIFPALALVSSPSRSVKKMAADILSVLGNIAISLLIAPKEKQLVDGSCVSITTLGQIAFRFLRNLWFEDKASFLGTCYINSVFTNKVNVDDEYSGLRTWTSSTKEYCSRIVANHKSFVIRGQPEELFLTAEMPVILCSFGSILLLHQKRIHAADLLGSGISVEPKLGVPILLIILFYNHLFSSAGKFDGIDDMMLKLLGLLPPLVSHPAMIPLVLQFLQPMLLKDMNPVIKATAIRMLCRTWEMNDRVFGCLQGILHPDALAQYASEKCIYISVAASILDVCKRNPDRGVDIILTVEACIEHRDPLVQSLGLQSLAHLCEADVVDFYTAWSVIANRTWNYSEDAVVSYGLSLLLRWGAMDAEAYPEAATNVLNMLWDIASIHGEVNHGYLWQRARDAAIAALSQYDVVHIQGSIPDFSSRNMEFLMSHANHHMISHLEDFEVRIINYEHMTRRRFVKQKGVSVSKTVKLLEIVPESIFSSGSSQGIKDLPGAALLCRPSHKDMKDQHHLKDVHNKYEYATLMISGSLQLSRNILLGLISLESWKVFMKRWMKSCILILEAKESQKKLDNNHLKAANDILQVLMKIAESEVPRSAENIALAIGALCLVIDSSAHTVKSKASKFLLNWLYQYEHEYRQWTSAISLGLISSCLHMTDHEQKFNIINTFLEVASVGKSNLVKGACGIGLGFSCHDLLTRVNSEANTELERNSLKTLEEELLRKIVRTLVQMIYQFTGASSTGILDKLDAYFPSEHNDSQNFVEQQRKHIDELNEDTWGIAGPIIGLANSLGAIYRTGAHGAVHYLKCLLMSWIIASPNIEPLTSERCRQTMSLGACLAIPTVASFCQKVELIDNIELDCIVGDYADLISHLLSVERSDSFYQSFLMASCAGAGNILSVVLNARLHSLDVSVVKRLLELFRGAYTTPHPTMIHLGGMLGVVNAMGAGAGMLSWPLSTPMRYSKFDQKESSRLLGPLLSNHAMEAEAKSLIQEIFLIAQNSDDPQLQHYAAWTVTFLRHVVLSGEYRSEKTLMDEDSTGTHMSLSPGITEDSLVMKLSMWLTQMNLAEIDASISTAIFIVRCLSRAPRLPVFDWGALVRRCMKYDQVAKTLSQDIDFRKETLRKECFIFSLAHANQFNTLLGFLDELSDLSRFKTLELNLQSLMLLHLADLLKIFSKTRVAKLFDDVACFFSWSTSSDQYKEEKRTSLCVSCWKGLSMCLNESSHELSDHLYNMERCMEVMFTMLPCATKSCPGNSNMEWDEAIKCLSKARQGWLSGLLQISDADFKEETLIVSCLAKVKTKAALVRVASIPLSELGKLKAYFLDINSEFIWNILVDVAITLQHSSEDVRRQWLVEATEILCVSRYPSTVLRFIGLLCGINCKYMPILVANKYMVLSDLPVALSSLLLGTEWEISAESVASYLCKAAQRLYDWTKNVKERGGGGDYYPNSWQQPIDESENEIGGYLLQVIHCACISLKAFLPVENQLSLANMNIT